MTSSDPVVPAVRARESNGTLTTPKPPLAMTLTPPEIASVDKRGTLTCQKSGDAKLEVNVRGVSGTATVRCRLVDRVEVPTLDRLDISKGPFVLEVRAFSKEGAELSDVPITVAQTKGNRVRVSGLEITPVSVGEAELSVRAGSAHQNVPVKVVRSHTPEALPIKDGKRISFSLPEGKYEARVTLKEPKSLRIEWLSAPYCEYRGSAKATHVVNCTLQRKGALITDNPRFLDSGNTAVSHDGVEIYEIP